MRADISVRFCEESTLLKECVDIYTTHMEASVKLTLKADKLEYSDFLI